MDLILNSIEPGDISASSAAVGRCSFNLIVLKQNNYAVHLHRYDRILEFVKIDIKKV